MGRVTDVLMGGTTVAPPPQVQGPVEGIVESIAADGMYFTIPSWDSTLLFGPSPYPPYQIGGVGPAEGDRCLVVYTDTEPWVIGWWPSA
jgi:hypothetical protein